MTNANAAVASRFHDPTAAASRRVARAAGRGETLDDGGEPGPSRWFAPLQDARRPPSLLLELLAPHDVWSADYKGQFKSGDSRYCYPLTVTDGFRRYLLGGQALGSPAVDEAKPVAHCWAHVRRKFVEAEAHCAAPCREVLDIIGQLDVVEREMPSLPAAAGEDDREREELRALHGRLRDQRSRPIVCEIQTWALAQRVLPGSGLGKAVGYLLG